MKEIESDTSQSESESESESDSDEDDYRSSNVCVLLTEFELVYYFL